MKTYMLKDGKKYLMELGRPVFEFGLDRSYKRLVFFCIRETQHPNIVWVRGITFGFLQWPWLARLAYFKDLSEES